MKIDFSDLKRNISLIDLILAQGYNVVAKKSARNRVFLEKGDDKLLVYKNGPGLEDFYYTTLGNETAGGDIINFLLNKGISSDYREAGEYLVAFDPAAVPQVRQASKTLTKLQAPTRSKPFKALKTSPPDDTNYLVIKRSLRLETLADPRFEDAVFNSADKDPEHPIAIFPLKFQDKVVGQEVRGVDHRGLVVHSDKTNGLWQAARPRRVNKVAVFESPIDALSHYQLFKADNQGTLYLATIGSASRSQSLQIAKTAVELQNKERGSEIALALAGDNDYNGQLFNVKLMAYYVSERYQLPLGEIRGSRTPFVGKGTQGGQPPFERAGAQPRPYKRGSEAHSPSGGDIEAPDQNGGVPRLNLKMVLPDDLVGQQVKVAPPIEGRVEVDGGFLVANLSVPADLGAIRRLLFFLWELMDLGKAVRLETPVHKDFNQDLAESLKKNWGQGM